MSKRKRYVTYYPNLEDLPEIPIRWLRFGVSMSGWKYEYRYCYGVKFWRQNES